MCLFCSSQINVMHYATVLFLDNFSLSGLWLSHYNTDAFSWDVLNISYTSSFVKLEMPCQLNFEKYIFFNVIYRVHFFFFSSPLKGKRSTSNWEASEKGGRAQPHHRGRTSEECWVLDEANKGWTDPAGPEWDGGSPALFLCQRKFTQEDVPAHRSPAVKPPLRPSV